MLVYAIGQGVYDRDETTPITGKGFWANPPDTVLKVLRDGRLVEPQEPRVREKAISAALPVAPAM